MYHKQDKSICLIGRWMKIETHLLFVLCGARVEKSAHREW